MSLVRFRPEAPQNADLAHLVERRLAKAKVAGSSPVIRSIKNKGHHSVSFVFYGVHPTGAKNCSNRGFGKGKFVSLQSKVMA